MQHHDVRQDGDTEASLRRENQELRQRLQAMQGSGLTASPSHATAGYWRPSSVTLWAIFLGLAVLIVLAFFGGYFPMRTRAAAIAAEAHEEETALPRVEVVQVRPSSAKSGLQLPGSIQAIAEAPILARADGYIAKRLVDIGDRVKAGQTLAEIDAPELSDQVAQAKATVRQVQSSLEQALANVQQGKADADLARVTADRSGRLVGKGAVSRQEDDQYQAQYQSKLATLHSLEKAIDVQRANVAAAQSSVARLEKMQSYRIVEAPFDGVVTLRNVDVGALVNTGSTLLFRIAQTATLRIYVNVPQTYVDSIKPGQAATLVVSNLPGRQFTGQVARTSNSLDPNSRTLLVEVRVPNPGNVLLPGMYAQVQLNSVRDNPPLLVPSEALFVRQDGAQVAVVDGENVVHLRKIEAGRDFGDRLEILRGVREGDRLILNPGDAAREGLRVSVVAPEKP